MLLLHVSPASPAQPDTSVQRIPHPPALARGFPLGVQRPQWPGIKMQRGGAARVSTASPGAHGARRRRPARPPGAAGPASRGAGAGNPAAPASRGRCPSSPGGPEEGRAGGRRAQPAPPPPRGWESREEPGARSSESGSPPRGVAGAPQSPAPGAPGQEKEEARDDEIGLFWRFEALRRAVRGEEKRHLPLASSTEGARRPAASGGTLRRPQPRARAVTLQRRTREGQDSGKPKQVSAERIQRSS